MFGQDRVRARDFQSIAWKMVYARLQYGLSISSVKVVRHKEWEIFCGKLWKKHERRRKSIP